MSTSMEFWGVEVKSGQLLKVNPGDNKIVHLSQASLGEVKKVEGREPVFLYIKIDDKKLVLGTLSAEKFPQLSFDLVVEKDFELSHNGKNGSVYFTGYRIHVDEGTDSEEDDIPGKDDSQAKPVPEKTNATKPDSSAGKQKVKNVKPNQKAEDSDSDEDDVEGSSTDDDESSDNENPNLVNREGESDENSGEEDESNEGEGDDEDTDESESDDEDETPPMVKASLSAELRNKRPADSATKTPVPDKKAKFITPQKTEGKKGISHIATPHPSKQTGKTPANSGDQTKQHAKKSGGSYPCKTCNRSFTTEGGLEAHTKAKHSAAA